MGYVHARVTGNKHLFFKPHVLVLALAKIYKTTTGC